MTFTEQLQNRNLIAARIVGRLESMLECGLIAPSVHTDRLRELVAQYYAAVDADPSPLLRDKSA